MRAAIQASAEPARVLAERYGISGQTVWKWRKQDSVHDRSHTPHKLQTTLTPAQEAVAVSLRRTLLLPLDDLLALVREFLNPDVWRSGLDRCLRRHGMSKRQDLKPKATKPAHKPFKAYEPGYLHIDVTYLPQMADEEKRRSLFVAIDRATRWVFVRIYPAKTAAKARRFLRDLHRAAPIRAAPMQITRVLTNNGKEFTDRLFGLRHRPATGNHEFDRLCVGGRPRFPLVPALAFYWGIGEGDEPLVPHAFLRRGSSTIDRGASCSAPRTPLQHKIPHYFRKSGA